MKYRPKHIAEYLALRCLGGLLQILPYRAALFVGWLNAWIMFHIVRFRVKETKSRIKEVFGDRFTRSEINKIAWTSWRNIVFSGVETILLPRMKKKWLESITDCRDSMEIFTKHAKTGKGGIIAVPHMGSWEMAALTCFLNDIPIFRIAAKQKNPLTDGYINDIRDKPGIDTVIRGAGTLRDVIRKLTSGRMLAILPDVRMRHKGVAVPFLGNEANLGPGTALFARQTDTPIFPCLVTRIGWGRHKIKVCDPIWPDKSLGKKEDVKRMTIAVMEIIEKEIRKDPGQWFWFNKRWVLEPLEK